MSRTDTERVDWLESIITAHAGIVLHDGTKRGFDAPWPMLVLNPGYVRRTLRQAIDVEIGFLENGGAK